MRIAVVNWSRRRAGGVETYLNTIIPELARAGHDVAFWSELDEPADRALIEIPTTAAAWCLEEIGLERGLEVLREWQPDVIYAHKLADPEIERQVLRVAPSVFFAHDYNGTCISGTKTFRFPVVQPCTRTFGPACLAHYFPHRCGGLSPITMAKLYRLQSKRQRNLHLYDAIVTHSDHMLAELIKHGLSPRRAYNFPYYVQPPNPNDSWSEQRLASNGESTNGRSKLQAKKSDGSGGPSFSLLFSGRMEFLKGAHVFIDALPQVSAGLRGRINVTFAGDGRECANLQRRATGLRSKNIEVKFSGWLERPKIEELLKSADLLVVPSLWPEPFGLVGPEAGQYGVPVAAFDVGGIHDWLINGVNGYLAPGNPPTASGLAEAIIKCLCDPVTLTRLRTGALQMAQQFNVKNHLTALLEVFGNISAQ
ncbi:MAG TPA: glycosyltransferase family 4 protein [Pyrinomonadaceae bacterium]|nr:glycosyltransferase family 4 protein [Pyrinomonadaceae bacterium]